MSSYVDGNAIQPRIPRHPCLSWYHLGRAGYGNLDLLYLLFFDTEYPSTICIGDPGRAVESLAMHCRSEGSDHSEMWKEPRRHDGMDVLGSS